MFVGGSRDSSTVSLLTLVSFLDSSQHRGDGKRYAIGYIMFGICTLVVMRLFSDGSYSAILTIGAALQCLAFHFLLSKVQMQKSVAGLSMKTLEVYVLVFCFRLSSTLVRQGYLPVDRSGDFVYQLADLFSLYSVFQLLHFMLTHRRSYQEEFDTFALDKCVPTAILMGMCIHGNMNAHWFFDTVWMVSMNLDTIALLPQLWMLSKLGGEVEGMTSHFCSAMICSRACVFAFWFYGFREITTHGAGVAGWQVLICYALQLILSVDFLYYYTKAKLLGKRMTLPISV